MVNLIALFFSDSGSLVFFNNHLSEFLFAFSIDDYCKNLPRTVTSSSPQLIYEDTHTYGGCLIDTLPFHLSTYIKFYWRIRLDQGEHSGLWLNHMLIPSTSTLVLGNFTVAILHPVFIHSTEIYLMWGTHTWAKQTWSCPQSSLVVKEQHCTAHHMCTARISWDYGEGSSWNAPEKFLSDPRVQSSIFT